MYKRVADVEGKVKLHITDFTVIIYVYFGFKGFFALAGDIVFGDPVLNR